MNSRRIAALALALTLVACSDGGLSDDAPPPIAGYGRIDVCRGDAPSDDHVDDDVTAPSFDGSARSTAALENGAPENDPAFVFLLAGPLFVREQELEVAWLAGGTTPIVGTSETANPEERVYLPTRFATNDTSQPASARVRVTLESAQANVVCTYVRRATTDYAFEACTDGLTRRDPRFARRVVVDLAAATAPNTGASTFSATFRFQRKVGRGSCSGTLIAPDVVITAAHCVTKPVDVQNVNVGGYVTVAPRTLGVYVTNDFAQNPGPALAVADIRVHPSFDVPSTSYPEYDIALVRLEAPAPVAPVRLVRPGMRTPRVGGIVTLVGSGREAATGGATGRRQSSRFRVHSVGAELLELVQGSFGAITHSGDSGGAVLLSTCGKRYVVAVHHGSALGARITPATPNGLSRDVLVKPHLDWVRNVMARWGTAP